VLPSDAESLTDVIDRRYKALIAMTTDPKDLTKALEGAAKWCQIKREMETGSDWGSGLRRGGTDG
jgi:hypothetical protein